jgi:predicted permease
MIFSFCGEIRPIALRLARSLRDCQFHTLVGGRVCAILGNTSKRRAKLGRRAVFVERMLTAARVWRPNAQGSLCSALSNSGVLVPSAGCTPGGTVFAFVQDLRYALRNLIKNPGFTTVAVLTLALGIGANVATYSVVYGVLLKPLPFPRPEQLVRVFDDQIATNEKDIGMSVPELWDLQDHSGVFTDVSAVISLNSAVAGGDRVVRAEALATSPDYFTLLGTKPELGRVFTKQDAVPGFLEPVVISNGFWRRYYGSDPKIVGRKMQLDGDMYTIVGVMPAGFRHPGKTLSTDVEVWIAAGFTAEPFPSTPDRSQRFINGAVARLKSGLTVEQAQVQLNAYVAQLTRAYPKEYPTEAGWALRLVPVKDDLVGPQRTELFILLGAVGFVLLIACVNIANLLLARSSARRREIAIRLAMGAGRPRLMRQLLTESTLLSAISGVVALVTVLLLKSAIVGLAPANIPRLNEVSISAGVLIFAFVISIVTGVLFGLVPAFQAAHADQIENLREGGRGSGVGRRHARLSRALVVAEVALSIVLLAGAGLLLRSFWRVLQVNPGFNPEHLTTVQIWIPQPNNLNDPFRVEEKRADFLLEVSRRVAAIPGVEQSSLSGNDTLPMNAGRNYSIFTITGGPADAAHQPVADIAVVDTRYFQTMEVPIVSGRNFSDLDTYKTRGVAVIDRSLARQYWPDSDPIGQELKFSFGRGLQGLTIVGIAGDINSDGYDAPSVPHIYIPLGQFAPLNAVIFLRSRNVTTAQLGDAVRNVVESMTPNVPVHSIITMDQVVKRSMANRRFSLELLGVFAVVALLLAAIGIYGVMSYSFSQRTHEVGIRVALGAQRLDILRMAVGEGMFVVAIGLVAGIAGAVAVTRVFQSMLFGVDATDPVTLAVVVGILAAVALLACYIPARRATRVDPLVALRVE